MCLVAVCLFSTVFLLKLGMGWLTLILGWGVLVPKDLTALRQVQETFPGLVDVDTAPTTKSWKHATAVLNECIIVSVLLDPETDKPNKKKVLEGVLKKTDTQASRTFFTKPLLGRQPRSCMTGRDTRPSGSILEGLHLEHELLCQ